MYSSSHRCSNHGLLGYKISCFVVIRVYTNSSTQQSVEDMRKSRFRTTDWQRLQLTSVRAFRCQASVAAFSDQEVL